MSRPTRRFRIALALASMPLLALLALPVHGQSIGPQFVPDPVPPVSTAATLDAAPHIAESLAQPLAMLPAAATAAGDQLAALAAWNKSHRPVRSGIVRPLAEPLAADLAMTGDSKSGTAVQVASGARVWATRIHVTDAYRLRLHLEGIDVPAGTTFRVYGLGEEPRAFGLELASDGSLWTPSVGGEEVFLEAVVPPGASLTPGQGFRITEVAESVRVDEDGHVLGRDLVEKSTGCLVDGTCVTAGTFPEIAHLRSAIAHIEFTCAPFLCLCTASLLNDTDTSTVIPYLLTANHCISTQGAASTLEAFWDFKTASCNGAFPNMNSLPRSNGATLLATASATNSSDYTLLRLNSIPGGRWLLGWNANASAVTGGTTLHRLSHPVPVTTVFPQFYSRSVVDGSPDICPGIPTSHFLYSNPNQGGTFGGSSGSPVVLANGQVVGQLLGACGFNPEDGCDPTNQDVDGAFFHSFPGLSAFLSPAPLDTSPCVESATTACLNSGRDEVKVTFQSATSSGNAQVMSFGGQRAETSESVYYFFFGATNFEVAVKVLNGCGVNGKFWVFVGGLTDQGWTVKVRDTHTGVTKSYTNALGHLSTTVADTSALSCS